MQPVTRKVVVSRCSTSSTSSGGSAETGTRRAGRVAAWLSAHATDAVVAAVMVGLWVATWRTLDAWTRYGAW